MRWEWFWSNFWTLNVIRCMWYLVLQVSDMLDRLYDALDRLAETHCVYKVWNHLYQTQ